MTTDATPATPAPVPYADRTLPTGAGDFHSHASRADRVGGDNARVVDDGDVLRLLPGPFFSSDRIVLAVYLSLFLLIPTAAAVFAPPAGEGLFRRVAVPAFVWAGVIGFAVFAARSLGWGQRLPWIEVRRATGRIVLPRQGRDLSREDVVRLQLVNFTPTDLTGFSTPVTPTAELQIVFHDAGHDRTACVLAGPEEKAVKRFSVAFRQSTGVPVSRTYRLATGEWVVEPYDAVSH